MFTQQPTIVGECGRTWENESNPHASRNLGPIESTSLVKPSKLRRAGHTCHTGHKCVCVQSETLLKHVRHPSTKECIFLLAFFVLLHTLMMLELVALHPSHPPKTAIVFSCFSCWGDLLPPVRPPSTFTPLKFLGRSFDLRQVSASRVARNAALAAAAPAPGASVAEANAEATEATEATWRRAVQLFGAEQQPGGFGLLGMGRAFLLLGRSPSGVFSH